MPPPRAMLPMLPMEAIMARGLLTPTMELMVLDLDMLLLFPSVPPPVLTPSPRALMPLPRAMLLMLPMEPMVTMARGLLMPTTHMVLLPPMPMVLLLPMLVPMLLVLLPLAWTPSPREPTPSPRELTP